MPLSNFTNLDFDQIKTNLIDYLRSNSNFTDYDFEGSNLSSILDVLAYNTYITSYNANMVSNEVFIDSATLRENVVALAKNIGYVPRSRKSSEANISFFVDTSPSSDNSITPASITLKKGPIAASLGSFGNTSFVFSILEDITRPVFDNIATFDEIPIYEGNLITTTFTVSSFNPNQRFILPNSGIDTRLINVFVTEVEDRGQTRKKYQLKEDLFDLDSESRVYFIQEIEDERYEIIFPDGIFGRKLKTDDVIDIEYIVCNGESANGINQFVFNGRLITTRNGIDTNYASGIISLLTTNLSSSGGDIIESVESIKKYAPRVYSSYNRALTASDYQALIPSRIYPETESITVFGGEDLSPPQYGKVFISIKPKNGDFIPNLIKENIKNKLKRYAVAGIVPEILDLKYLYIEVNSKVYYNTNLENSSSLSNLIISNVQKYSESTELNRYGAKFKYSKFLGIIDNSDESVTSNISTIQIRRDLRVVLNTFTEYKIGFGNEFHVKSNRFNIKTSAFRVSGINSDLYFSDFTSNIESETGSIFIFSLPSQTSKDYSIVRENVGTINYKTGEIVLNPLNISSAKNKDGTAIIEISAIPKSNDVIGKQDLYLQLDISKSTFEMVQDSIVSGFDFSAANYTVSSSYTNGNLVRP